MSQTRVWKRLLGVEHTVIEGIELDGEGEDEVLVVCVRPTRSRCSRCSRCDKRCPGYDQGEGRRRWRAPDVGLIVCHLEADAPRVRCEAHGVVVAAVPWARARARHTRAFEDTCAWLTAHAPASVVATYLRVAWRTVTDIVTRVVDDRAGQSDRLEGLRRIGIDEIAHRKGQRYITVVICHETGRIVWAHEGRNQETMRLFFDELGKSRSWKLTHVSADGAEWIHTVVAERAMNARICLDPFHVAQWATEAVDEVRRQLASDLRAEGRTEEAKSLKNSRWALLHNNYALNVDQRARLATIAATNNGLYRAYLLKEQLLGVIHLKGYAASHIILKKWLSWAKRCRIEPFVKLARTIENYKPYLENTLNSGLSNARSEATNTHLRVLTRRSYGFHSAEALIAMAMLTRGGLCPDLPGRAA